MSGINIQNLIKLINHLKSVHKDNFNMANWIVASDTEWYGASPSALVAYMEQGNGDCGTVACVAGHAAMISAAEKGCSAPPRGLAIENEAVLWLGLTFDQANRLFAPTNRNGGIRRATLPKTIAVLERLKKTSEAGRPSIDWNTPIKKEAK